MKIMKQNKILQNKLIYIKKRNRNKKTKLSKMNNFREKKNTSISICMRGIRNRNYVTNKKKSRQPTGDEEEEEEQNSRKQKQNVDKAKKHPRFR